MKTISLAGLQPCLPTGKRIVNLDGYVEIDIKYLKYMYKNWIKFKDPGDNIHAGGFLVSIESDHALLRNIRQDSVKAPLDSVFYAKIDSQQYSLLMELLFEIEKRRNCSHCNN